MVISVGRYFHLSDRELEAINPANLSEQETQSLEREKGRREQLRRMALIAAERAIDERIERRAIKRLRRQMIGIWIGIPAATLAIASVVLLIAGVFPQTCR